MNRSKLFCQGGEQTFPALEEVRGHVVASGIAIEKDISKLL
jgi:hypothetical protein